MSLHSLEDRIRPKCNDLPLLSCSIWLNVTALHDGKRAQ